MHGSHWEWEIEEISWLDWELVGMGTCWINQVEGAGHRGRLLGEMTRKGGLMQGKLPQIYKDDLS